MDSWPDNGSLRVSVSVEAVREAGYGKRPGIPAKELQSMVDTYIMSITPSDGNGVAEVQVVHSV